MPYLVTYTHFVGNGKAATTVKVLDAIAIATMIQKPDDYAISDIVEIKVVGRPTPTDIVKIAEAERQSEKIRQAQQDVDNLKQKLAEAEAMLIALLA